MRTTYFLKDELWYCGAPAFGNVYPVSADDEFSLDLGFNQTFNQLNPVFLSNMGRYIWVEKEGVVRFKKGAIEIDAPEAGYEIVQAGTTLKEAALAAAAKHYPPTGTMPDKRTFMGPQYNSWVMFLWNQKQEDILSYARSIIEKGYKPGLLIIDDTWQQNYGVWEFNRGNFPDPKAMMDELREMGFMPALWMCPYVSSSASWKSPGIYEHIEAKRVIMNGDIPRMVRWWEGFSAGLDFTEPAAVEWINEQMKRLERDYGVAGFKLDGGDPPYYGDDYRELGNFQSMTWIDCVEAPIKEARCCYKLAGKPIIQRLNDKCHRWDSEKDGLTLGLSSLLPSIMAQGLVGYYFGCPDMVGGGGSGDFDGEAKSRLDYELIIRWCQASALLPMIQFSFDVWNHEEGRLAECCKKAMDLRESLLSYIVEMLENAAKTGIPAVRYLEYDHPHQGLAKVQDEFMLGDKYLVAPVLEKGATKRTVLFPKGLWRDIADGKTFNGGEYEVDAPLDKLPVFEKLN